MFSFYRNRSQEEDKVVKESVSVLISAYKSYDFIEKCLDSISNQDYEGDYEIIVGIDGCKKTLKKLNEIKHKYKNFSYYYSNKNVGKYIISNSLILKAKHDIITIFDSDDVMYNNHLSYNIDLLKYNANFVTALAVIMTEKPQVKKTYGIIFLNKKTILELNGYHKYRCGCDSGLINRLKKYGLILTISDKPTMNRCYYDNNLTRSKKYGMNSKYRNNVWGKMKNEKSPILKEMKTTPLTFMYDSELLLKLNEMVKKEVYSIYNSWSEDDIKDFIEHIKNFNKK